MEAFSLIVVKPLRAMTGTPLMLNTRHLIRDVPQNERERNHTGPLGHLTMSLPTPQAHAQRVNKAMQPKIATTFMRI